MDLDEPLKKPVQIVVGENIEALSLADLTSRIGALQAEISRVTAEISKKQASKSIADAFFKS